jgi:hypothetical protein
MYKIQKILGKYKKKYEKDYVENMKIILVFTML